jgi:hypothetical protein
MPAFESLARRSAGDINFENTVRERDHQRERRLLSPSVGTVNLAPSWDTLYGGLRRTAEDAEAAGMNSRVDLRGIGAPMPASSNLRRSTGLEPADGDFDATDYQLRRAALDRTLNDNFAAKWSQRTALSDADRARDPSLVKQDDQQQFDRSAAASTAADNNAIDHFARTESLRRADTREKVQTAAELLPYSPAYLQSQLKYEGTRDTNDARRDAAGMSADARTGSAAINSLGRLSGVQTYGDPEAEKRIKAGTDAILPNVPGQPPPSTKVLSPEEYQAVLDHFGGDAQQAAAAMRQYGYRR